MINYGMVPPTWEDCCGQPRKGAPAIFANGPERLVCEKCGRWCHRPTSLDPRPQVTSEPEWYWRMWAS